MRPKVLIGLGNPLSGDDGIGWLVAELMASDPRVPDNADILCGGTDLLRQADRMVDREQVILVDVFLDDSQPGTVSVLDDRHLELESPREHAHYLSVCEALRLLRRIFPSLAVTRFKLVLISIGSAHNASGLSPELAEELPVIVDRVLEEFR